jgi:solute carrier family 25 (mitochondrial phosphate transporter), member 23/24/25/41
MPSESAATRSSSPPNSTSGTVDMTRRMICGGVAGLIAKTATNPLDRIRMLSQTGEHGISGGASVYRLYEGIIRNEGIIGLWAGNGANLLRVFPAKAVVFASNDLFGGMLRTFSNTPSDKKLNPSWSFLAGGLAGMSATACTYPLDLARGRISGKLANGTKEYNGIIRTMVLTVKDEGFLALYKGITPTLLGAMPYEGIKFGTVGILELIFPSDEISPTRKMIFGGAGGVMAGILTYPNDTVRRLLQLQGSRGTSTEFKGYWDCVQKTYQAHGIQRFYFGVTINVIRMAPNAAVQFGSYELLKKLTAGYV